ncbi:hypothetical protein G6R40_13895 [Chryseobacterium sp. POL2]|uniref:hypothetical protein n=1 Tax=Chryseobacterium sp. POL2 TaxID=2713414 RepID=UPI0013E1D610|nr:hypothetical protein [Chryseobacterium sp. POL2]QIG90669.1 hypothetical protein G6R40_13895 [Chryseobacterium sp. POL2]
METIISNSLNHLKQLNDNPFTLQKVAYWLYEYNDLYKETKTCSETICEQFQEWKNEGLPYDCFQKPDYCTKKYRYFTDFYEGVEYGVKVQELDAVCKIALEEYNSCNGTFQLKDWLIKYFDIGYNKLVIFYYDHLDYSVDEDEIVHPHFGNSPIGEFGVCIDRKYYQNLIEFEDVFKMLLYEKKVYPEKLKEIDEEMSKIVLPMIPIQKIE